MTYAEFVAIIADLERHLAGEGYALNIQTHSGAVHQGVWSWVDKTEGAICIALNDKPPTYLTIGAIETIQLSET